LELAAHATHRHNALECRPDGATCVVKTMLCAAEVSGGQRDIEAYVANGINDAGKIVGYGTRNGTTLHAFLLTPR
jgi:probable HAF family extracellular repeat protein